jgi:hypothetical protein
MPGGFVCSGRLRDYTDNLRVREAALGNIAPRKLFSKEQREFFADMAPDGIKLDDLTFLGPIFVLKAKWTPDAKMRPMTAELWMYPDGSRVLELSMKCLPNEGFQAAAEARAFLSERGISLSAAQETKTKKALKYFVAAHATGQEPALVS